ncbi:MAG TPA: DUF2911 domain-containing protein [Gemmatimonadales bacterium]|nr:DUF2911 domain-containing protein [Gemmatimonadales bacterium]
MHVFLLTVALATQAQHADSATFITRLGTDTIAVERFTFDGRVLDGVAVARSPSVSVHRYRAVLGAGGVDSLTLVEGPAGRPARTVTTYRYSDDSVQVETRRDSATRRQSSAVHGRPLPFAPDLFGPWEVALRGALAGAAGDPQLTLFDGGATIRYAVHRLGGDSLHLAIANGDFGPLVARMDGAGRLQSLDLRATTDKFLAERVSGLDVDSMTAVFAARELAGKGLGNLSPRDTARATVGGAHVEIDYGRPMRRGRTIFGNVVPWDTVWRTGANQATQLITDKDLVIGGTAVPAGTYSLFTIPSAKGWQLIINKQHGQWGTEYDAKQDWARVPMRVRTLETPSEQLTIGVRASVLSVAWDRAEATVEVKAR